MEGPDHKQGGKQLQPAPPTDSSGALHGGGGASATVAAAPDPAALAGNKGSGGESFEACDQALAQGVVLSTVMEWTGKGCDFFIAPVSKEWKEHYRHHFPAKTTHRRRVVESVERLRWARKYGYKLGTRIFRAAAEYGDLPMCKALHGMGCSWGRRVCTAAVRNERHGLSILQWLRTEDLPDKEMCPWSETVGLEACRQGKLEMLEWMLTDEVNAPFNSTIWNSPIRLGRITWLEWVLHHPKVRAQMEAADEGYTSKWRDGAAWAALEGNLEVLKWLHANAREQCRWDARVCFIAVHSAKSLSMLKWLRSEEVMCPWDERACPQHLKDARDDDWNMVPAAFEEMKQWVHANGHPCGCQD